MGMMMELRHAIRALARRPGFTVLAVLTLGLGIASSTAMFSVVYHLLIAPLPFSDADRIVYVWRTSERMTMAPQQDLAAAWARSSSSLEWLSQFERRTFVVRQADELPITVRGGAIAVGLPELLGVEPVRGRSFAATDTVAGAAPVVLLGESFWKDRFGGSDSAVGQTLRVDGQLRTILGVVPDRLAAHHGEDRSAVLWLPIERAAPDELPMYDVIALLKPGVAAATAQSELEDIARATPLVFAIPGEWSTQVVYAGDSQDDATRRAVLLLFCAVVVVLLIAAGNVSGLLLARAADRRQELAVRAALGARAARLAVPLILESLILAAVAVVAGLLLSIWAVDLIRAWRPQNLQFLDAVTVQPAVVAFAVGMAALAALVSAGLSVVHAPSQASMNAIRSGDPGSRDRSRVRAGIVTAEIALSTVLVIGAALLIRTVAELQRGHPGFNPEGVLAARIVLPETTFAGVAHQEFASTLAERARALAGVAAASMAADIPTRTQVILGNLEVEGADRPALPPGPIPLVTADAMYVSTLGIPLREGRFFMPRDPQPQPVVVSETFARTHFPGTSAVGRRVRLSARGQWLTIIGVVGDVAGNARGMEVGGSLLYLPADGSVSTRLTLLVRAAPGVDPLSLVPALRAALYELNPELPLRDVVTLRSVLNDRIARERFAASLLAVFALLALALAVTGLFGLMSYAVARRTREIGVRLALGAPPRTVHVMLLGEGARLTAIGLSGGVLAALWAVRFTESLLHGIAPRNPASFLIAVVAIGCAAIAAVWLPARRAMRVDPHTALRSD